MGKDIKENIKYQAEKQYVRVQQTIFNSCECSIEEIVFYIPFTSLSFVLT